MLGSELCTQAYVGSDRPPLPSHHTSQLSTPKSQKKPKNTLWPHFWPLNSQHQNPKRPKNNNLTSHQTSQLSTPKSQKTKKKNWPHIKPLNSQPENLRKTKKQLWRHLRPFNSQPQNHKATEETWLPHFRPLNSQPQNPKETKNIMISFQTSQFSTPVVALRAPSVGMGAPSELVFT